MIIEFDFKSQLLIHLEVKVKSSVHGKISKYKNISQSVTSRFDSIKEQESAFADITDGKRRRRKG